MSDSAATAHDRGRCTYRKHVVENGKRVCDCGGVIVSPTAAGNATVATVLHDDLRRTFATKDDRV